MGSRGASYVGTSGFAYPQWKGGFYPPGTSSRKMLEYYATRLGSVEINYTFRREPTASMVEGWLSQTPERFRFVTKAPMRITHFWPLEPPEDVMTSFLESIRPLGERLGAVLFQTGPRFTFDADRLERFMDRLPAGLRCAFEFRHPSWDAAGPLLADRGAARVATETENDDVADLPSEPFTYVRLRRTDYDDSRLDAWAKRLRPALRGGRDVFAFFKHEDGDTGPAWAEELAKRLRR